MSIHRETRPAYHLAIAHIICTLAITGVTLMFTPDVGAKNNDWCDRMFEELWFQEVPPSIQKECGNRFKYNTNVIKSQMFKFSQVSSNY